MRRAILCVAAGALALTSAPAFAEPIRNPIAVFAGLDKITGGITSFEVSINPLKYRSMKGYPSSRNTSFFA